MPRKLFTLNLASNFVSTVEDGSDVAEVTGTYNVDDD